MSFKFENLIIWRKSMDLGEEMNTLVKTFPKDEVYNLSSPLRRASDSIVFNISERSILQYGQEYRKFLRYSIRSLAEVVTCLRKENRRNYLSKSDFDKFYNDSFHLMNMTIAFRNKIK